MVERHLPKRIPADAGTMPERWDPRELERLRRSIRPGIFEREFLNRVTEQVFYCRHCKKEVAVIRNLDWERHHPLNKDISFECPPPEVKRLPGNMDIYYYSIHYHPREADIKRAHLTEFLVCLECHRVISADGRPV